MIEKKYFKKDGPAFRVSVEPDWLHSMSLFVGIETADLTIEECDTLMSGRCEWKLASADQVLSVFDNHEEGLHLSRVDRPPSDLPPRIAYYQFERRQDYWSDVLRTNALGLCFRLEPGREGFMKEQPENVVLLSPRTGAQIVLKFAVYIVRNQ